MRIWSLHPRYLDTKALLAVWREGLLAKKVLEGKTIGYRNHPQLARFRKNKSPISAISSYLYFVWKEAEERGYNFDISKINKRKLVRIIPVTEGQLLYEFKHLLFKLSARNKDKFNKLIYNGISEIYPNPIFYKTPGNIEFWERV